MRSLLISIYLVKFSSLHNFKNYVVHLVINLNTIRYLFYFKFNYERSHFKMSSLLYIRSLVTYKVNKKFTIT